MLDFSSNQARLSEVFPDGRFHNLITSEPEPKREEVPGLHLESGSDRTRTTLDATSQGDTDEQYWGAHATEDCSDELLNILPLQPSSRLADDRV